MNGSLNNKYLLPWELGIITILGDELQIRERHDGAPIHWKKTPADLAYELRYYNDWQRIELEQAHQKGGEPEPEGTGNYARQPTGTLQTPLAGDG